MSNHKRSSRKRSLGFTLIEVMIALFILVLIGAATSKAVIDAAKLKEALKDETEFSSEFRTSLSLIERDLNQVFNPRWLLNPDAKPMDPYQQPNPSQSKPDDSGRPAPIGPDEINRILRGNAFVPSEYWSSVFNATGIRPSRFKGNDTSISFVSASHVRIYQQKKESIYAKIKYVLAPQPPNPNLTDEQNAKRKGLQSLIKFENTRAFDLEDPQEAPYLNRYTVLNGIKKLKFTYYKIGEKDSIQSWDSETQDTKNIFPEAVEMEVVLQGANERILEAKVLFKLESPNHVLPTTY